MDQERSACTRARTHTHTHTPYSKVKTLPQACTNSGY